MGQLGQPPGFQRSGHQGLQRSRGRCDRLKLFGQLLPNPNRRGVPYRDQNLKKEIPNVWAAGDIVVNPLSVDVLLGWQ